MDLLPAVRACLDFVYPRKCGLCGFDCDHAICSVCHSAFERFEHGAEFGSEPLVSVERIFRYAGRARQAIERLKYERVLTLATPMSDMMREFIEGESAFGYDVVVPVPIHPSRRRLRGFNQSDELTRGLSRDIVRPHLIARSRATRPQATLSPEERRTNLIGAFRASEDIRGLSVLLVDDVITSGATAEACAESALQAGALRVGIVAFAGAA